MSSSPRIFTVRTAAALIAIAAVGCTTQEDWDLPSSATTGAGGSGAGGADASSSSTGGSIGLGGNTGAGGGWVPMYPELWYAVDQLLVHVELVPADGTISAIHVSPVLTPLEVGQNAITMLADGSLLGARLSKATGETRFFHIPEPPRDGSEVAPVSLGIMPDGIMLEGLYTDCDGRVYGMDTGVDDVSAEGNRLLRFTGDVTAGDFTFTVVSDLATADVADIDDMSPGINDNQITDNPGLAIDTGTIHAFDYETGSGNQVASGGSYGIHALGGPLFGDGISRLYVLSAAAELFEVDPVSFQLSDVLAVGPQPDEGTAGWSGLAGPLTDCTTGFIPE